MSVVPSWDIGSAKKGIMMLPKGKTRKQEKAAVKRREVKILSAVRLSVFERDGGCRYPHDPHDGPLELAHLEPWRRSRTVNRPPEQRHLPEGLIVLCRRHHGLYDGGLGTGKVFDIETGKLGANGVCRFVEIATGEWLGET